MPTYQNAAAVRAAHPGIYDDLSDQQIEAGLAKQGGTPAPQDEGPLGEMRHATSGDDYTSAAMGELGRTGKEAAIGLARSPLDLVKGLFNTVAHPIDTAAGLAHTVMHPVGSAMELAKHPRDAGSLLGQMLLAPKVPGAANTALAEGPSLVGRGMSAVGRGAEALGTSKAVKGMSKLGSVGEVLHGNPGLGVASAVVPPALEYGGRALQRGGAALEGLDLSLGKKPGAVATVPESRRLGPARVSTEVPNYGGQLDAVDGPGSWERSPSSNPMIPGRRNPSITGLEDAMSAGDSKWANDKSAQPGPASPIETFLKNDPQARVGGEGRTTGQFPEGKFGLNNLDANTPYETPGDAGFYNNEFGPDESYRDLGVEDSLSGKKVATATPEDQLAQLSERMGGHQQMSPEEASALFNKRFGLGQPAPVRRR